MQKETVEAIQEILNEAIHYLGCLPSGIDVNADEYDQSPEDMTAHLGGLVMRRLDTIAVLLDVE